MNQRLNNVIFTFLTTLLFIFISSATYVNYKQEREVDRSKLPQKLETSKQFQRWITNLKNKDLIVDADEFRLKEENEIYNTKWLIVKNIDQQDVKEDYEINIAKYSDTKGVVYSPSKRQFIDYRNVERDGYLPTQVHYYGLRDDKLLDARILGCDTNINCYFDRAYFLDNDVFVVSEFSKTTDSPACPIEETCSYTIKLHLVDLNKNSRSIYTSKPFNINLALLIPEL